MDVIKHTQSHTSFNGKDAIEVFRIAALISALRLEQKGITVRRGFSALKMAKQFTGLRTNLREKQIERLKFILEQAKSKVVYVTEEEAS